MVFKDYSCDCKIHMKYEKNEIRCHMQSLIISEFHLQVIPAISIFHGVSYRLKTYLLRFSQNIADDRCNYPIFLTKLLGIRKEITFSMFLHLKN